MLHDGAGPFPMTTREVADLMGVTVTCIYARLRASRGMFPRARRTKQGFEFDRVQVMRWWFKVHHPVPYKRYTLRVLL